jgi:hypothetical protein
MSTAPSLKLSLENMLETVPCCRFCGCMDDAPCPILLVRELSGIVRLARTELESNDMTFCSWFVDGVCSSPLCMEKLLAEKRNNVLLFDGSGRAIPERKVGG